MFNINIFATQAASDWPAESNWLHRPICYSHGLKTYTQSHKSAMWTSMLLV